MKKLIVLLLVVCLSASVANATMRKGPYLIYPDDNTKMMVLWQLTAERTCTLEWGEDTSYSSGSVVTTQYGTDNQHKYTITGLTPGTKYYYQVIEDTNHTGTFYAAPPESATSVKFLAVGDTLNIGWIFDAVARGMIDAYEADPNYQTFSLHMGDISWDGWTEAAWDGYYFNRGRPNAIEMQANLPVNGAIGNHDWGSVVGTLFDKYFPYPYPYYAVPDANFFWSFDYGPAHFAIVEQYTYGYPLGTIQTAWLENDLATTNKEWKFVIFHESAYATGHHSDHWPTRDAVQPLAERYEVDIVFQGHNHYYARCVKNGVTYVTTGGGGQPTFTPESNYSPYVVTSAELHHFSKISIDNKQLELTAVEPNGVVIESFTLDHRCYVPTLPWSDGFEDANDYASGDIGGGWDISTATADINVQGGDVNSGSYAVSIEKINWVQKAVSTKGFGDIHVKYARKTAGLDAGEYLNVEWSVDNTNWTNLESTQDTTWTSVDMTCDANANNSPGFRVRFRSDGAAGEYAYVDDVEITGTSIHAAGDFDGTGSVGFYDLDLLTSYWLASCSGPGCCDECDIDESGQVEFVDFAYLAGGWAPDTNAPTPDPMTWSTTPQAAGEIGETALEMVATRASDGSGVEYYFDCTTAGGNDSGWQGSSSYEDTGLSPGTSYTYQVKARDKSPTRNQTGFSTTESASTDPCDSTAPTPDPMTWATEPNATGSDSIAMVATAASDAHGVEYYFDEITDGNGASDSGWQDSPSFEDAGLDPSTQYTYKVKARDKSLAQNETAFSTTKSATTEAPGLTLLFSWTFPGYNAWGVFSHGDGSEIVNSQCACEGGEGANLKDDDWMEMAQSTVGYTDIQVKYTRETNALDAGEYLTVKWYDGSTWYTLEQTQVGSCGYVTFSSLTDGAGAANNANFKMRWEAPTTLSGPERCCVDDVEIWGMPIP